jgi:hypothetical protein
MQEPCRRVLVNEPKKLQGDSRHHKSCPRRIRQSRACSNGWSWTMRDDDAQLPEKVGKDCPVKTIFVAKFALDVACYGGGIQAFDL